MMTGNGALKRLVGVDFHDTEKALAINRHLKAMHWALAVDAFARRFPRPTIPWHNYSVLIADKYVCAAWSTKAYRRERVRDLQLHWHETAFGGLLFCHF